MKTLLDSSAPACWQAGAEESNIISYAIKKKLILFSYNMKCPPCFGGHCR